MTSETYSITYQLISYWVDISNYSYTFASLLLFYNFNGIINEI